MTKQKEKIKKREIESIVWELCGLMWEMCPFDDKDARKVRLTEIMEELKNLKLL